MIQVEYVPRILKSRDRAIVHSFFQRLTNPLVLFVWLYTAFQIHGYELYVLFVFSGLGAVWHVYHSYSDFVFEIMYMEKTEIQLFDKLTLWTRDFFIQDRGCVLSFWWSFVQSTLTLYNKGMPGFLD